MSIESSDLTPFKTRSKLLSMYRHQVQEIFSGGDPYPSALEVNPSNHCGQNCSWCISGNTKTSGSFLDLSHARVIEFFRDFKRFGGKCIGWSGGGEPTDHPQFNKALVIVRESELPQGLLTHGAFRPSLLDCISETCDWVRISIDTYDPIQYAHRRKTTPRTFDVVVHNISELVARGADVGLNMNVAEWNKNHISELYKLANSLGAGYLQIRPTLRTPHSLGDDSDYLDKLSVRDVLAEARQLRDAVTCGTRVMVSEDKFTELLNETETRTYSGCKSHRLFVVLNYNGDLCVCMYHLFDKRFALGNIFETELEGLWNSPKRMSVIDFCEGTGKSHLDHRLDSCQMCCKGHEINKVLFGATIDPAPADASENSPFF